MVSSMKRLSLLFIIITLIFDLFSQAPDLINYQAILRDAGGQILHDIRRAQTKLDFFAICRRHLDHKKPMLLEPFTPELHSKDVVAGCHT